MKLEILKIKAGFQEIIKKMVSMDSQIYLVVNSQSVGSNVYLPSKDLVKIAMMDLDEVFSMDDGDVKKLNKNLKLGFFDGQKILNALKNFDAQELKGEIKFMEYDDCFYAEYFILRDKSLEVKINCLDPDLGFISLNKEQIKKVLEKPLEPVVVEITKDELKKIDNLNKFDGSEEYFGIYCDEKGFHICGKTYDYVLDDSITQKFDKVYSYKKFLKHLDEEDYVLEVVPTEIGKLIFTSKTSKTKIIFNLVHVEMTE